jgi:hypothetical protein
MRTIIDNNNNKNKNKNNNNKREMECGQVSNVNALIENTFYNKRTHSMIREHIL